jgi:hypothetical protein
LANGRLVWMFSSLWSRYSASKNHLSSGKRLWVDWSWTCFVRLQFHPATTWPATLQPRRLPRSLHLAAVDLANMYRFQMRSTGFPETLVGLCQSLRRSSLTIVLSARIPTFTQTTLQCYPL